MNTTLVKVKHMIHVVMAAYMILTGCSNTQRSKMLADGNKRKQSAGVAESPEVTLPSRSFNKLLDGSLQSTGHWKLKVSEAPSGQLPFGAQPLNSTMRIGNSNGLFTPPRRPRRTSGAGVPPRAPARPATRRHTGAPVWEGRRRAARQSCDRICPGHASSRGTDCKGNSIRHCKGDSTRSMG